MNYTLRKLLPDPGWLTSLSATAVTAGMILLAVDVVFLLLHLALNFGQLSDRGWHMEVDGGYSELFQYVKYIGCAAVLFTLGVRHSSPLRLFFAAVFLLLFLEDWQSYHENFHLLGRQFITFHDTLGLRKAEIWELIYAGLVGLPLLGLLAYALLRTKDENFLSRAKFIFLGIVMLAGFGVGVDMLHGLSQGSGLGRYVESSVGTVEDWGEMLSLSGLTLLVIDDLVRSGRRPAADHLPVAEGSVERNADRAAGSSLSEGEKSSVSM